MKSGADAVSEADTVTAARRPNEASRALIVVEQFKIIYIER